MNVDYGKVVKYEVNRGFGFVERNFLKKNGDTKTFFHITTIRKYDRNLLLKLQNGNIKDIYFWYEYETTSKGRQVTKIIKPNDLELDTKLAISQLLENKWLDTNNNISEWLEVVSLVILDEQNINLLKEKIESLIRKQEEERLELENARRLEQERQQTIRQQEIERIRAQKAIEEDEFQQLVDEIRSQGFTHSSQVSNYITQNSLGYKYKHISGHLEMSNNENSWIFTGGFPRDIYARLCSELNLTNNGSSARAGRFISFNDLSNRYIT